MRKDPLAENVTSSLANRWPVTNGAGGALGTAAEEPTAAPSVERKGEKGEEHWVLPSSISFDLNFSRWLSFIEPCGSIKPSLVFRAFFFLTTLLPLAGARLRFGTSRLKGDLGSVKASGISKNSPVQAARCLQASQQQVAPAEVLLAAGIEAYGALLVALPPV